MSIVSIDLLVDQNEEQCHTEQYESEKYLVLRRGSDIQFQVNQRMNCINNLVGLISVQLFNINVKCFT